MKRFSFSPSSNTFGQILSSQTINGLRVSEVVLPPRLCLPPHFHEMPQMCVVLDGSYCESVRGKTAHLRRGTVLLRPPSELHSNRVGANPVRTLLIDLEPERYARFEIRKLLTSPFYFSPGVLMNPFEPLDLNSTLSVEGTILLLLHRAARTILDSSPNAPPEWLDQALRIIHMTYREKLTLNAIAAEVNIHPVTLSAAFRRIKGLTVHRYITQLRLEDARRQIFETDTPLSQIAQSSGFFDQSHFGKVFKRYFGTSPDRLRRRKLH